MSAKYEVRVAKDVIEEAAKLHPADLLSFSDMVRQLEEDPLASRGARLHVPQLSDPPVYRIKLGELRVYYLIVSDGDKKTVVVIHLEKRGDRIRPNLGRAKS
jgi:mRNA-degrading endonuclease RelE of RelBE toxin-antitoxin system